MATAKQTSVSRRWMPEHPLPRSQLARWVLTRVLRRWQSLAAVLATAVVAVATDLLKPWPMKILIDNGLYGKHPGPRVSALFESLPGNQSTWNLVVWCVVGTVLVFLIGRSLSLVMALAEVRLGRRLAFDLAEELFAHLQRLSLRFHHRRAVGDSIRRVARDSACVASIVRAGLLPVFTSVLTLISMFAVLWALDQVLTLACLVVVPVLILILRRYAGPMAELSYQQQEAEGRLYAMVERTFSAMPVIHAFARHDETDAEFRAGSEASIVATLSTTRTQLTFKLLVGLTTAAGTAVILGLGAHRVLAGELTVGGMLVFITYLAALYSPLESLVYTSQSMTSAIGSARRALDILMAEPDVQDRPGAQAVGRVAGHVRLESVTFGYDEGQPVLHNIDLDVTPGETVAIVGPSGAGKSTLVSLIPRFFDPWHGRLLIDGIDTRDLRLRNLRDNVAIVLQEPFLFPTSIAANIAYGRPGASPARIEAAARAANAHDFIMQLPRGYDTVIGERGATLSGGERQRISIARALLKDAPILILDEPTSALDARNESHLVDALHRLMHGRTTFIIAHRLSTIRSATQIVVLDRGRITEIGSHSDLTWRNGFYARLCTLHFRSADEQGSPDVSREDA